MKKMFKDKKLYIFLLIVLLFFKTFSIMNYSVDTYLLLASSKLEYVDEYLSAGRIFTTVFFFIQGFFHIPNIVMYITSYLLAIIFSTLSIYELNKVLDKYISNKFLSAMISIAIIINPFIIELWLFIESGIMMFSIFACIKGFKNFDKYLETKNKSLIGKSFLWMIAALFSYQGTIALFACLCAISIIKNSKSKKKFIKNNILMFIIYIVPTIINYIFITMISRERVGANHNLIKVIKMIIISTKEQLINCFGLLPNGFYPTMLLVTFVILIYYTIKNKRKRNYMLSLIYITLVTYLFTIAPVIPQNSDSLIMFPRTSYAFASLIPLLFIINNKNLNIKITSAVLIVLLSVELYSFTKIEINRYIVNYEDKQIIYQIEDKVKKYEEETGINVEYLSVYNQENSHMFYNDINDNINVSAKNEQPNSTALYVYYSNRKVKEKEQNNNIYNLYFKNKHWQYFSLDQVVIVGNTIHWYIY